MRRIWRLGNMANSGSSKRDGRGECVSQRWLTIPTSLKVTWGLESGGIGKENGRVHGCVIS